MTPETHQQHADNSIHPERAARARGPARFRRNIVAPILIGLFACHIGLFLAAITTLLPMSMDISYPEGAVVARALDVAQGQSPYRDWRQWPHVFAPYAPLTYWVPGTIARLLDLAEPDSIYWIGRLQSWLGLLAVCILAWLLAHRLGLNRTWALVAVATITLWRYLFEWSVSYRPDAIKSALALGAIWCLMREKDRPIPWAALICLYLSFWYKPTAWGVLLAIFLVHGRRHGFLHSLGVFGGFGLAGLIPAFTYNALTDGRFFLNIIDSLMNGFSWAPYREMAKWYWIPPYLVAAMGIATAIRILRRSQSPSILEPLRLLALAALCSLFSSAVLMFKAGADINYFFVPYVLLSILAIVQLNRLWRHSAIESRPWRETLLWLITISALICFALQVNRSFHNIRLFMTTWTESAMIDEAQKHPGPALSVHPYISVKTDRDETILDYYQYRLLVDQGRIDPQFLLARLEDHKFGLVVIYSSWYYDPLSDATEDISYLPRFLDVLKKHYLPLGTMNELMFFIPQPAQ